MAIRFGWNPVTAAWTPDGLLNTDSRFPSIPLEGLLPVDLPTRDNVSLNEQRTLDQRRVEAERERRERSRHEEESGHDHGYRPKPF
jgi:hypothetical protein